ncbi:MAG TPA: hypothetical protein VEB21_14660, partial [Terriglobales bacterium]|nr:hypothetical protein [Terriglobales bacterium]
MQRGLIGRWKAIAVAAAALLVASVYAAEVQAKVLCGGDCNNDCEVTIDEVMTMVHAALTGGVGGCGNGDSNQDGTITVDEILTVVSGALQGCFGCLPPPFAVCGDGVVEDAAGEQCDDGGVCAGWSAGKACDAEEDCSGSAGVCIGGTRNLRGCLVDDEARACPGGICRKCRPQGGDGCAQNCTSETRVTFPFASEEGGEAGPIGSAATIFGQFVTIPLILGGQQVLSVGRARDGEPAPVAVRVEDFELPRIPVQNIACACIRPAEASTCGGALFDERDQLSPSCTAGFPGAVNCPADRPCAPVHGAGNAASGFIGCSGASARYSVDVIQDCNSVAGEPPFDPIIELTRDGNQAGSASMTLHAAIGTVIGLCTGSTPDYGPDQQFC